MGEIFTHKQAECLRLLKDYISYLALDEKYSHECKYHNNEDACRLHEFLLEQMDRIKEEAEVLWMDTFESYIYRWWHEAFSSGEGIIWSGGKKKVERLTGFWENA